MRGCSIAGDGVPLLLRGLTIVVASAGRHLSGDLRFRSSAMAAPAPQRRSRLAAANQQKTLAASEIPAIMSPLLFLRVHAEPAG
jgi:hypothetical protein